MVLAVQTTGTVIRLLVSLILLAACIPAATLEKLGFDEMVTKSTAIVRARIGAGTARQHGPLYYTHHSVTVLESYKGRQSGTLDVVVPGGTIGRSHQTVAGIPDLTPGTEMVLFLWTSSKGLTHVIGLSQGAFQLEQGDLGEPLLTRAPLAAELFEATGRTSGLSGLRIPLSEFRTRVQSAMRGSR